MRQGSIQIMPIDQSLTVMFGPEITKSLSSSNSQPDCQREVLEADSHQLCTRHRPLLEAEVLQIPGQSRGEPDTASSCSCTELS